MESLRVFLAHNRSWQKAATALHVHKQTLVYRMRRVEELSGRKLDRTGDVSELWFALRAAEVSGLWKSLRTRSV
jgi:purine catabolism regulator